MKRAPIRFIELGKQEHLQVYPDLTSSGNFKFIWRDASGIEWDDTALALVAREPDKWQPHKLFEQIIYAAFNEYGIKLEIVNSTKWSANISNELKVSLRKSASETYAHLGVGP